MNIEELYRILEDVQLHIVDENFLGAMSDIEQLYYEALSELDDPNFKKQFLDALLAELPYISAK